MESDKNILEIVIHAQTDLLTVRSNLFDCCSLP